MARRRDKEREDLEDETLRQEKAKLKAKKEVDKDEKKGPISKSNALIKANAFGDNRNLLEHGSEDLHYMYSIGDAMQLLTWIRKKYLKPVVGGDYTFSTENISKILITEPYHIDNFVDSLNDDISKITATNNFAKLVKWQNMPETIIIPILFSGHWRLVTILIDYTVNNHGWYEITISYDDPFGKDRFPESSQKSLETIIEEQVKKLIEVECNVSEPRLQITINEKAIDQQGVGENGWDCAPIMLSNIEDIVKLYSDNYPEAQEFRYLVPIHTSSNHKETLVDIRVRDVERISSLADIPINHERLQILKNQLTKSRTSEIKKIKQLGIERLPSEINDWEPAFIDMFFSVINNKREAENIKSNHDSYSKEELSYAYHIVLGEISKKNKIESLRQEELYKTKSKKFKLNGDLDNLIQVKDVINKILGTLNAPDLINFDKLLQDFKQVGQLIQDISWNENDAHCIRNKYGYRNRHKEATNKINKEGAGINFETLGHLKELADDKDYQSLLIQTLLTGDFDLIKNSLQALQGKIYFALSKERAHLTIEQAQKINDIINSPILPNKADVNDVGFLLKASAYYHDTKCINEIIELLNKLDSKENQNLNLSNKIDKYYLGYFFTKLGEIAKEVSDFIKPELSDNENLIKSLFTKIGKYRDTIKMHPHIIYGSGSARLTYMKQKLEASCSKIKSIISQSKGSVFRAF